MTIAPLNEDGKCFSEYLSLYFVAAPNSPDILMYPLPVDSQFASSEMMKKVNYKYEDK